MNDGKKIFDLEPREAKACSICGARNIDTRKIRIDTQRAGTLRPSMFAALALRKWPSIFAPPILISWIRNRPGRRTKIRSRKNEPTKYHMDRRRNRDA